MKIVCVYLFIVLAVICDPTKAGPARVRRQGWSWNDEAAPSTQTTTVRTTVTTTTPSSGATPSPEELRLCVKACPTTSQYNPVCGTNNVTYDNEGKLNCARNCGAGNVSIRFMGTCAAL